MSEFIHAQIFFSSIHATRVRFDTHMVREIVLCKATKAILTTSLTRIHCE